MKRTIEIIVTPSGEVFIEALGYRGNACEAATRVFEEALGAVAKRKHKAEFHQRNENHQQQRLGS